MDQLYTIEEVQKHSTPESAWVIYSGDVYDITDFISLHPGGAILTHYLGQDVEQVWKDGGFTKHLANNSAFSILSKYKIGKLKEEFDPEDTDGEDEEEDTDGFDASDYNDNNFLLIGILLTIFFGILFFVMAGISN